MSFKKKLFAAIGPLVIAAMILGGLLLSPFKIGKLSPRTVEKASTSMAVNVLKGNRIKNTAMADEKYVPFFGSSELSRINAFHPSTLAVKYDRSYRPFLLGAAGTQSLSQFLMLQSMEPELQNKKAVFIISPQWFTKKGIRKEMFSLYYSQIQMYQWVISVEEVDDTSKYFATRLLNFSSVRSDTNLKTYLKQIEMGVALTLNQKKKCENHLAILTREDEMFGRLGMVSKDWKIKQHLEELPTEYDTEVLDNLAYKIGEKQTNNNEFQISNNFYKKRVLPAKGKLKNSQENFDYRFSPEFADFQMVLTEIAKLDMDVLFVIPPVNEKWANFTGISTEMLDEFSVKINHQLRTQGFTNIVDFTHERSTDYFMEDTIHLGWRGWVALDEKIQPFLESETVKEHNYQISNEYLKEEWQQQDPKTIKSK